MASVEIPGPARLRHLWLVPLALTACSAAPIGGSPVEPPPVVLAAPAPCASGAADPGCTGGKVSLDVADAACIHGPPGPRCDGLLGPGEAKTLAGRIEQAQALVLRSGYQDVGALVDLARLQLRRDEDISNSDGASDAARALKNGMRAVIVNEVSSEARLVLALALARSLQGALSVSDPVTRDIALELLDIAVGSVGNGSLAFAARSALEGYVALERGQIERARQAFELATSNDAGLATAWMGLGDVARGEGQFEAAEKAYTTAALLLPEDAGARRSIKAATRREAFSLPAPASAARPALTAGSLAPAPPPLPVCPASPGAGAPGASLCKGLAGLARASTRDEHNDAAMLVIDGWRDLEPLCDAGDPACGPHVAQALAAAARGFQAAGRPSRSISAMKYLLAKPDIPGAAALMPAVTLEIADRHFSIGVFDRAAEHYAQHVRLKGTTSVAAAERAMTLFVALMNVDAATKLAAELAVDKKYPDARRADWLLLAAGLMRAVQGPDAAVSWLAPHKALLASAGRTAALAELRAPLPAAANPAEACAAPLACAVRRLAGEPRWLTRSDVGDPPAQRR